jgi:hypothetical protein
MHPMYPGVEYIKTGYWYLVNRYLFKSYYSNQITNKILNLNLKP